MQRPLARLIRLPVAASALALLAACAGVPKAPVPATPTFTGDTALAMGVSRAKPYSISSTNRLDAGRQLSAFLLSCPVITSRKDASGLTRIEDWDEVCASARGWPREAAHQFFRTQFVPVTVGDGAAFATGYFEPQIRGSRVRQSEADVPVYGVPRDLERCWRDDTLPAERQGQPPRSRRLPDGRCVPHFTRAEIEQGALGDSAEIIGYAADPIEFFFLQIQGSGRLVGEDGEVLRIGYAGQNGHGYTSIGKVLRERGLLGDGPGQYEASMPGIIRYLRENPQEGAKLMRKNASWVFFQELIGEGPLGSLGVPVRAKAAVAVDPRFVPYGAPVLLDLDRDEADGLWIAQDTGGAIKGANRFDTFWGVGPRARETAGTLQGRGRATVLLPLASAKRLGIEP